MLAREGRWNKIQLRNHERFFYFSSTCNLTPRQSQKRKFFLAAFAESRNTELWPMGQSKYPSVETVYIWQCVNQALISTPWSRTWGRQRDKNLQFCEGVMSSGFSIFYPFFYGLYSVVLKWLAGANFACILLTLVRCAAFALCAARLSSRIKRHPQ